jgi:formate dehydrogenase major subunit
MTNHWIDVRNADCMLQIGSNPAENHPASFGWVTEAKERGAKLISVDPRFTRTSSKADIYARMRSGTDIAFIGGMIKHVLDDMDQHPGNYNMVYVREYTNASFLIDPDFKGPVDLDGLFSGYAGGLNETDNANRKYDNSTWKYQFDEDQIPKRDKTLQDPNCVFQILKRHFDRYDKETVCRITGTDRNTYDLICRTYAETGKPGKAGTILYAMGTTQHTNGTQMIRSYVILQLLLGNIGICGGGINALRGESNVQGSTDMCLLAHILPGYLKQPINKDQTLEQHNDRVLTTFYTNNDTNSLNWWKNYPKYMASLLKAWYRNTDHNVSFNYLPKTTKPYNDYSWIGLFEAMYAGTIKGLMCWGQNPAVCGPNLSLERKALEKLDWLVAVDLWETETAAFWKRPGVDPTTIDTEVFMLPAACSYEKEGSVTNSGRWMQWRYKAVDPPGDAEHDLGIINKLVLELKRLYTSQGGPNARAITELSWDYGDDPCPLEVAKEVNGYYLSGEKEGKLVPSFGSLQADGSTSSGNWLYCNSYVEEENLDAFEKAHLDMYPGTKYVGNRAARRYPLDVGNGGYSEAAGYKEVGLYSYWSWDWPVNRRIIYNRASVDLDGVPWDSEHPVISWNGKSWDGDVPDGGAAPMNEGGYYAFIMHADGHAHIFGALADGPLPEHYEPWESPVPNLISSQQNDPSFKIWAADLDKKGDPGRYPIVATTYRVVEHWQAGQMSRNLPWLVEMMPEMFVELSEELAAEKGIKNGGRVIVETARGQVEGVAVVTKRFKPFKIYENATEKTVHQIGMPWHWGYTGLSTGDSANMLTPHVGDANTMIPEFKAFLCNVKKA